MSIRSALKRQRIRAKMDIDLFLKQVYDGMVNRVNGHKHSRYMGMDICSRQEFYNWAKRQGQLYVLFDRWNRKGHKLKWRPTVDRIDSSKGYELGNLRWLTQSDNSKLGRQNQKSRSKCG